MRTSKTLPIACCSLAVIFIAAAALCANASQGVGIKVSDQVSASLRGGSSCPPKTKMDSCSSGACTSANIATGSGNENATLTGDRNCGGTVICSTYSSHLQYCCN